MRKALTREQVIMAVERTGCEGIPVLMNKWWGEGTYEKYGDALNQMAADYPDDVCMLWYQEPGYEKSPNSNPGYRFGYREDYSSAEKHSIGESVVVLPDWSELDQLLESFPDPNEPGNFDGLQEQMEKSGGRYTIGCWWRLFHERFWGIRGMENLMLDYYDNMEELKQLGHRLIEFYKVIIDRYCELGCDAIFTSDDLGHQQGPMMSPAVFEELYFPLYKEVAQYIHSKGMHFFLHSCGDNSLLLNMLIEAGLDVFHPVQKGCMDMEKTAETYGGRISFLAGVDVQHMLVEGTPEQVRQEVRRMKDTFNTPKGGLLLAMGNGIMPDAPMENIQAAFEEMYCL